MEFTFVRSGHSVIFFLTSVTCKDSSIKLRNNPLNNLSTQENIIYGETEFLITSNFRPGLYSFVHTFLEKLYVFPSKNNVYQKTLLFDMIKNVYRPINCAFRGSKT